MHHNAFYDFIVRVLLTQIYKAFFRGREERILFLGCSSKANLAPKNYYDAFKEAKLPRASGVRTGGGEGGVSGVNPPH